MGFPLSATTISGLLAVALVLVILKIFLSYWRLRHIPGPWLATFSPIWLAYHTLKNDVYLAVDEAIKIYGSPVRVSQNIVMYNDPEHRRHTQAPRTPFLRGDWFEGMKIDPRKDNIVSMKDEKEHSSRRAMLMPGYSGKDITTLESDIDGELANFLQLVDRYAKNDEKFDFAVLAPYFTTDALCKIGFSRVGGFLKNNRDEFDYFKTSAAFFPIMELSQHVGFIRKVLTSRFVQAMAGPKAGDRIGLGAIMGLAHEEAALRFSEGKERHDMLGSFIRHGLSQEDCEVEAVIQVIAGADSTATALRITFWHIISSTKTYRKLCKEISDAVESGKVSWPCITNEEAKQLPYLEACIREGTRIFMPLMGIATVVSPPEGYTINKKFIPADTQIGIANYSMLRRTDIFGADADTFRPERFLEGDSSKIKEFEQVQELVFASGRFACLGKQIALMELRKALFELIRRYDFSMVDPLRAVHVAANGIVVQKKMFVRAYAKVQS